MGTNEHEFQKKIRITSKITIKKFARTAKNLQDGSTEDTERHRADNIRIVKACWPKVPTLVTMFEVFRQ